MKLPHESTDTLRKSSFWRGINNSRLSRSNGTGLVSPIRFRGSSALVSPQSNTIVSSRKGTTDATTRLGISPTYYSVPNESELGASTLLATTVEREVVFFDQQAAADNQSPSITRKDKSSSLFGSAWWDLEGDDDDTDIPPPPNSNDLSSEKCSNSSKDSIDLSKTKMFGAISDTSTPKSSRGIFGRTNKMADTRRRAKEIVHSAREKSSTTVVSPEKHFVNIFLLLLEPKSKLFELIQLRYPGKHTTVADLLNMIPKNATERVLARQAYMGISRPQRGAPIITNLQLLASGSSSGQIATRPSANILAGEIILALPTHADPLKICSLAKQILANAHIQKLMAQQSLPKTKPSSPPQCPTVATMKNYTVTNNKNTSTLKTRPVVVTPNKVKDSSNEKENLQIGNSSSSGNSIHLQTCQPVVTKSKKELYIRPTSPQVCNKVWPVLPSIESSESAVSDMEDDVILNAFLSKEDLMKMCRARSPNQEGDILDNLSDEGSLESWRTNATLDSSLASKYAALQLEDEVAHVLQEQQRCHKRLVRQWRNITRMAWILLVVSMIRYRMDPNGYMNRVTRTNLFVQPLGWHGLGQFVAAFVCCIKFQRLFQVSIRQSRCPVLHWLWSVQHHEVMMTLLNNNSIRCVQDDGVASLTEISMTL